jgi:predicted RNA methylase
MTPSPKQAAAAAAHPAPLDPEIRVADELLLQTAGGATDLLLAELRAAPATRVRVIERGADSLRIGFTGPAGALADLRLYTSGGVVLAPVQQDAPPSLEALVQRIAASLERGVLGALTPVAEPLTFRLSPLRYGRWEVRDFLSERFGWRNEPSAWDLNLEVHGQWLIAQIGALHVGKRLRSLRRIPASTNPVVASIMVRLLDPAPGETVLDPFCGAGTLLAEVLETIPDSRVVGSDTGKHALDAARANLSAFSSRYELRRGDARTVPVPDGAVRYVVSNLPFGKRVGSHRQNIELYPAWCTELSRILAADGRAVLLTEEKDLLRRSIRQTGRLRIVREQVVASGGLHPSIFIVEPAARGSRSPDRGPEAATPSHRARRNRRGP